MPFIPGQYYHFYQRGNNRQTVFFERENYLYFLRGVKKYLINRMDVLVYCLMPTHYHFLVRIKMPDQTSAPSQTSEVLKTSEVSRAEEVSRGELSDYKETTREVSLAMQKLGISYTKAINKRFNRSGTLFQSQFQAKTINNYDHLLTLSLYIHANPVKDGLTALPENWEYSNYREWVNLRTGSLVDRQFIADHFGSPREYQSQLMEYIQTRFLPEDVRAYLQELE